MTNFLLSFLGGVVAAYGIALIVIGVAMRRGRL